MLEVERPLTRVPDDGSFARPHYEPHASGRHCALRFYGRGRCTYAVEVPRSGTWSLWLRYAATAEVRLRAGFLADSEDDTALETHALPSTGSLTGKHAWGWALLQRGRLEGGSLRFAIDAAPLRPDCLLLTESDEAPSYLEPRSADPLDEATRAALARPVVSERPPWLAHVDGYRLPAWFEESRVSFHTRLTDRMRDHPAFETAAQHFRELGVRTLVRHLKTAGEGAWWPSERGAVEPWAEEEDVARGVIERAHEQGLHLIAYYRHMEDAGMAERHPEWVARDDRGRPYLARRNHPILCLSSPYADFVESRLLELVERGADGFYFDEHHMPRHGCWCEACRAGFVAATGLDFPTTIDEEDARHRKLIEYQRGVIERAFAGWRHALHEKRSDVVLLVSTSSAPDFLDRHFSGRLLRLADSVKTEFDKGASARADTLLANLGVRVPAREARLALGWTFSRDGADGRPPHVWIPRIDSENEALHATAAVVAHGGIANLDHEEDDIPDAARFGAAIALAQRAGPELAGLRPLRWAAIHVPELALDRRAPDDGRAWREVIGPMTGAYELLLQRRAPVGIVTDHQLGEGLLEGYALLFLPAPEDLTDRMRTRVSAFEQAGGVVIRQADDWDWDSGEGYERTRNAFLQAVTAAGAPPLEVEGGPPDLHAIAFTDAKRGKLVLALTHGFGWVRITRAGARPEPPPAVRDVGVRIGSSFGSDAFGGAHELLSQETLEGTRTADELLVRVPEFPVAAFLRFE